VARQELLRGFRNRLTEEERRIADPRALNRDWAEVAVEHGGSPEALCKKLARSASRQRLWDRFYTGGGHHNHIDPGLERDRHAG
jgi:hypothetical protein